MTLKRLALGLSAFFVLTMGSLALVLFWTAEEVHKNANERIEMYDTVGLSEALQIRLLSHRRETSLHEITKDPKQKIEIAREDRLIRSLLKELRQFKKSGEDARLVAEVQEATLKYLEQSENYLAQDQSLRTAHLKAVALTEANLNEALSIAERSRVRAGYVRALGVGVALLCIICLPVIGFLVRRRIYQPILDLRSSIEAFERGGQQVSLKTKPVFEIFEVAEAFRELIDRLADQKKALVRYLAGVAHDIKNPLGAIKMSAEMLAEGEIPEAERKTMLEIISRQTVQLNRMVGDFLDASRVEAGQLELKKEKQDLVSTLRDSVILHQQVSSRHDIVFHTELKKLEGHFDPTRISQVINNLISNAIKYSPDGGEVEVFLGRVGRNAIIRVADHGVGIPDSERERVFEPFRRSKDVRGSIAGVGLGLSVSKGIITSHGGQIHVEKRKDGKGTVFQVSLPLELEPVSLDH